MTEPIITLIHCPRCNTNVLIAWPPDPPTDWQVATLEAAKRGHPAANAQLDQVRAHALAEHQAGRSEAPCRPARKTDQ
jgi:hypothetical protein